MPDDRNQSGDAQRADATEAELAVLEQLWKRRAAHVRDLAAALYPPGGASALATVQKLLDRLGAKGLVERRRDGRSYLYLPSVDRPGLVVRRLRATAEALCGGSFGSLLTHLVEAGDLDRDEIARLRELVDGTEGSERNGDPR